MGVNEGSIATPNSAGRAQAHRGHAMPGINSSDPSEADRLAALASYGIMDTEREPGFDNLARLAAQICETAIALISFVAEDRQWLKAHTGFEPRQTPLSQSVCAHVLRQPGLLVIPDLTQDLRTRDNSLVTGEPHIRFYAGARLETPEGLALGALCVIDHAPRPEGLTAKQATALETLARQVMERMELRRSVSKRADAALRASEARFRATFEQAAVGIAHVELDGRWLAVNERLCAITGYPHEELLRLTFQDITYPDDLDADLDRVRALLAGEIETYQMEKRYRRRDGTLVWVLLTVSLVRNGEPDYFIAVVEDISARKADESRLQELQAELLHVARLSDMGQIASALAHELNQPLTAPVNFISAGRHLLGANEGPLAPDAVADVDELMACAAEQALHAGQVIRRLRDFMAKGKAEMRVEILAKLVEEAGALALIGAKEDGIDVALEFDPRATHAFVDRVQVRQVLLNLIRNGVETMQDNEGAGKRELRVSTALSPNGEMIEVAVADTGAGLAPEVKARLFEPFVTTKPHGMGIGLSICRSIVEMHGGRLWAEPNGDAGTAFRFTVPRADSPTKNDQR